MKTLLKGLIDIITQEYYDVIQQSNRDIFVRLSLLNYQLKKVDEIQGVTLSGSISDDATSDIRHTLSISLIVKDSSFLVSSDKKIWMDKYIKVEIGIKNKKTSQIVYWNKGFFMINQPSISYSPSDNTLSFTGVDLMAKMTGKRNGQLQSKTVIPVGTPISTAIQTVVKTLGGFPNVVVQQSTNEVPYDITKEAGDTIYSLIDDLRNLYMDNEIFFSVEGIFYYQKITNKINDPIVLNFYELYRDLVLKVGTDWNFENIHNRIIVNGRQLDNGTRITYTLDNTDVNSPFNINTNIGIIPLVINNEKIFTNDQAILQAEYELFKHNNLCNSIDLEVVPIYWLESNQKIYYRNDDLEIDGQYVISNLTIPLTYSETMSIKAYKIYSS